MRLLTAALLLWASVLMAVAGAPLHTTQSPPAWIMPGATIDYDFANGRYWNSGKVVNYDQVFTFTRATTSMCTSASGNMFAVASGVPCISDNGYQSWQASTNLLLQSQFAASWTATASTLTANTVTSPETTTTAATLIEDSSASTTHFTTQSVTKAASSIVYEYSVYAKATGRTRIGMVMDDGAGNGALFICDLSGQTVGVAAANTGTGFTSKTNFVQGFSNGWTRCAVGGTSNTTTTIRAQVYLDNGSGTAADSRTYTGAGVSGVQIYGAQLEVVSNSLNMPTMYVPTTTVSATRNQDQLTAPATVGAQWSFFAQSLSQTSSTYNSVEDIAYLDDGTTANRMILRRAVLGVPTAILTIGSATQWTATLGSANGANTILKAGVAVQPNSQLPVANGSSSAQTNATILTTAITTMHIGEGVATQPCSCYVQRVTVFGNRFINNISDLTL